MVIMDLKGFQLLLTCNLKIFLQKAENMVMKI